MPSVRVRHGRVLAGYNREGQRISILAHETHASGQPHNFVYDVRVCGFEFDEGRGEEPALLFAAADQRDLSDLWVRIAEYPELADFPTVSDRAPIVMC
jgi:hypothetical protein